MSADQNNPDFASAQARIEQASSAIRDMSRDLAEEIAPRPTWLDRISEAIREAPVQSLIVAFLIGIMLARR
ncbi:hypothetical protein JQ615_36725 [Bradyrhizobium jicamae]|uniref:DUF3618 domain-containing protein n=1 Tax=Bradyrhizobium jicamae TaxID=280332 RepID=A0ABS5FVV4_9BRAD|nr:hypothetical protein [Bradyrhizobium jicamae]MBR0800922.1 hypothetical protein [Bradyrhizobium jicamae]